MTARTATIVGCLHQCIVSQCIGSFGRTLDRIVVVVPGQKRVVLVLKVVVALQL